jgi:hypothetical protein
MKPGAPRGASMLPSQMPLRADGMFRGKGNSGRGDGLLPSGGMSFGVDAYNAFRGMFESSGSMGINVAASLSGGSGQIGMQQLPVPVRSAPLGLTALGSDFASRFSQPSVAQGLGEGGVDNREGEREAGSSSYKSAYADLENVPDILTNGGRCVDRLTKARIHACLCMHDFVMCFARRSPCPRRRLKRLECRL